MADATLQEAKVSRAAMARAWLVDHPQQARAVLGKFVARHQHRKELSVLRQNVGPKQCVGERERDGVGRAALGYEDRLTEILDRLHAGS